jgi:protein involved in polysaccharide export with SLBB domain
VIKRAFLFLLVGPGLAAFGAQGIPAERGGNLLPGVVPGGIPAISNIPVPGEGLPMSMRGEDALAAKSAERIEQPAERLRNEFQNFIEQSTGLKLPMFGERLFGGAPGAFAPGDDIPVAQGYVVGAGDELLVRAWGQVNINLRLVVDRNGAVDIPKVGVVRVSGLKAEELEGFLKAQVGRVFKNFQMNVTLGRLRSIQVLMVGNVQRPGNYTISAMSTLVNALFASGGPSAVGSMRKIQLRRGNVVIAEMDLYDLLLKGDKSKDMRLLQGDVIHIPPLGPLVALSGSIQVPAVFELKGKESVDDLLKFAGGFTATAFSGRVTIERIQNGLKREILEMALDEKGLAMEVENGDLIQVLPISPQFDKVVMLRGHVSFPRRVPWREGMRIKDLIPDRASLVPYDYWLRKNAMVLDKQYQSGATNEVQMLGNVGSLTKESQIKRDIHQQARGLLQEINWDYASISRLDSHALKNRFVPFNLGQALNEDDPEANHILLAGDVITIYNRADIRVPISKRSIFISLEGEFENPGLYQARPGESLRDLVKRVGGVTPQAYLFGSVFTRESTRRVQQEKKDQALLKLERELRHANKRLKAEALTAEDAALAGSQVEERYAMIESAKLIPATGRIVLEMKPSAGNSADLAKIQLRDGDRFVVPSRPAEIYVMGEVYNQHTQLWKSTSTVAHYLAQSGGATRNAEAKYTYIIRADGSVLSRANTNRSFAKLSLYPGDTIVVPEKLDYTTWKHELKDWAMIFGDFAMGAAAIRVLSD